jgi:hypothetical protein
VTSLCFTRSHGLVGRAIRLLTAWTSIGKRWVPNHLAIRVNDWVWESHMKTGVVRVPLDIWRNRYRPEDYREVRLDPQADEEMAVAVLERFEGFRYESPRNLIRVAWNRNTGGESRLYCSELGVRFLMGICHYWAKGLDPNNTDPDELWEKVR